MKKLFIGVLVAFVLICAPSLAHATTVADLQAMIAQLTARLNALDTSQNQSGAKTSVAIVNESNKASLTLSYDPASKESGLYANQDFSVKAVGQDIYVTSAALMLGKKGLDASRTPNGTNYTFTGIKNTSLQAFSDSNISDLNTYKGWLVKAGQTATFSVSMSANPQLMYSGIYTAELSGVHVYAQSTWTDLVPSGSSMPSNSVTIVGENKNPQTQSQVNISWSNGNGNVQLGLVDDRFEQGVILGWISLRNDSSGSKVWDGRNVTNLSGNTTWTVPSLSQGPFRIIAVSANYSGNYCATYGKDCNSVLSDRFNITNTNSIQNINLTAFPSIVSQTQSNPAVSLTVNGSHSATVKPGDSVTYSWSNAFNKADKFSSNWTASPASCGNSNTWIANTANGVGTYTIPASQVGCTYTITYTGTQSSTGIKASDTVIVSVVAPTTASQPTVIIPTTINTVTLPAVSQCGILAVNSSLTVNQTVSSCNGKFRLILQGDGNAVLYNSSNSALWASKTNGKSSAKLIMQGDGNLAIYDSNSSFVWGSVNGNGGKTGAPKGLSIQDDGNLVIYSTSGGVLWASNTAQKQALSTPSTQTASAYSAVQSILDQIYQRLLLLK